MPLPFPPVGPVDETLAAMITPAVLISASGTLALSTSNRLGRIVDRVRKLSADAAELRRADPPPPDADETRAWVAEQLGRLARRIRYLQTALGAVYLAIGLLVGCSLLVGVGGMTKVVPGWVPVTLGLTAALSLLVASLLLFRESRLAVVSTLKEMNRAMDCLGREPVR